MGDGHPLGGAGRTGREDDPGIVAAQRGARPPAARRARGPGQPGRGDDADDAGFTEHQVGPLLWIIGIDRHVGRSGGQHRQDRDIEGVTARRHPDADAVAAADATVAQPLDAVFDVGDQLAVGQLHGSVVDGRRIGVPGGGVVEDVDQRAWRRGFTGPQVVGGNFWCLGRCHKSKILSPSGYGTASVGGCASRVRLRVFGVDLTDCARRGEYSFAAESSSRRPSSVGRVRGSLSGTAVEETSGVFGDRRILH